MATSDEIRARGWRQCSVASDRLRQLLKAEGILEETGSEDLLIVVTHDCDLVSESFEREPHVELLLARPIEKLDGNSLNGKNPRRLHFALGEKGISYEVLAVERYVVPRELLAENDPDTRRSLDDVVAAVIPEWIARRYSRSALPDSFNERVKKVQSKIRNRLKKDGELVEAIFIVLVPTEELAPEYDYRILVTIVAREDLLLNTAAVHRLESLAAWMSTQLDQCGGVTMIDRCQVVSDADFSLADMRRSLEWDVYDDLSYRAT